MMAQRHECPPNVERHTGSGVNPGFLYVRAARADALVPFFKDAVQRGLVEFYHRWDNVIDHFGFTFLFDENDLSTPTSKLSNETTIFNLRRPRGCQPGDPHEQSPQAQGCLRAGFFPHDQFPRFGSWPLLRATARVHHIVQGDAALGPEHAEPPGIKPSRGPRQRLDRYDDKDFDDYEGAMADCNAVVDRFAKSLLSTLDASAAWWLCANHAERINCYPKATRNRLMNLAAAHDKPPAGGTWNKWFARRAVKGTHEVKL
jgi:hypothetical protein